MNRGHRHTETETRQLRKPVTSSVRATSSVSHISFKAEQKHLLSQSSFNTRELSIISFINYIKYSTVNLLPRFPLNNAIKYEFRFKRSTILSETIVTNIKKRALKLALIANSETALAKGCAHNTIVIVKFYLG